MSKLSIFLIISSIIVIFISYLVITEFEFVEKITLDINTTKARCLDGSPYNFLFKPAKNNATNKYLIFFEGGAWCGFKGDDIIKSCISRSEGMLGSSNFLLNKLPFFPLIKRYFKVFSSDVNLNPQFSDWNKIYFRYCDGVGFLGNVEKPLNITNFDGKGKNKTLFFRGFYNVIETLEYLKKNQKLNTDFSQATDLVLAGSSAGGQAVLNYANYFQKYFKDKIGNKNIKIFGICDSGIFLNKYNFEKQKFVQRKMWLELANFIENKDLIKTYCDYSFTGKVSNFTNCFFADNYLENLNIPILILQSLYDSYAIRRVLGIDCYLLKIFSGIYKFEGCSEDFRTEIDDYKTKLISKLSRVQNNLINFYIPDCLGHNFLMYSNSYDLPLIPLEYLENITHTEFKINSEFNHTLISTPREAVNNFIKYYDEYYYKSLNLNLSETRDPMELENRQNLMPIRIISGNEKFQNQLNVCKNVRDIFHYMIYYKLEDIFMEGKSRS